jgi:hypothetical protein
MQKLTLKQLTAWYKKHCKKIVKTKAQSYKFFRNQESLLTDLVRSSDIAFIYHKTLKPGNNKNPYFLSKLGCSIVTTSIHVSFYVYSKRYPTTARSNASMAAASAPVS